MSIRVTTARAYTKAIFNLAVEEGQVENWQKTLAMLAECAEQCAKSQLLVSPQITNLEKVNFFTTTLKKLPAAIINLLKLLACRKSLALLPAIYDGYCKLFFAHKNMLEVTLISAAELNGELKDQLISALKKRYHKEIILKHSLDSTLIGGAIIKIADKVIDGSIKGKVDRLKQNLLLEAI
jgi:F-type H+-transporting ATPase subunit delta